MNTRRDRIREYKERRKPAGVFQVKNTRNGKVFLGSSLNLEGSLNRHRFSLKVGGHRNETLQREWNEFGPDAFVFEVLEVVEVKDDPGFDLETELSLLEEIWIEKLRPFGDQGYNSSSNIRQA